MSTCQAPHRYDTMFAALPEDQSYPFRHKCAGCVYELGFQAGVSNQEPSAATAIDSILKSQAAEVRHRSPRVAYYQGYTDGLNEYYLQNPRG
ncbi:hypothetical protein EAE91_01285 [Photorhabdus noenieputensis]|uniref:hypothetical protein n=1 Tax=Photorhabdus noenieputensis TaxID=1208607 RepID=UPI001BD62175|nr:hypothetical protein [Photorhabdus noenieputensis]MBS9435861.1 hypothetical protein [Photorhabdus noenieputensis]MCK3667578.1 hypothetical protein [Photorhabdus noenieputensis]